MIRKLFILPALFFAMLIVFGCQQSSITDTTTPTTTSPTTTSPTTHVVGNQVGNIAPDFQLQDIEGNTITLSSLRGSPVVLNFWATWCGPCRHEMPFLQQIYDEWLGQGLVLLAINLRETPSEVRQFMQDNGLFFPALLDANSAISLEYEVTGIPVTFFIDKDGIIQAKRLGSFSSVAEIEDYLNLIMP